MLCNLTNTVQPKNTAQMHLEILATRLANICPNVVCDIGTTSDGLTLHVTHRLDTNPVYVGKLIRSYVMQSMYDLELRTPRFIHIHIPTESGATMLHCQHELTIILGDNRE